MLATMIQEQEGLANDLVGAVHFTILINEDRLKKSGHPKWNEVFFRAYNEKTTHCSRTQLARGVQRDQELRLQWPHSGDRRLKSISIIVCSFSVFSAYY